MKNPARGKLRLSGFIDIVIIILFVCLLCFTAFIAFSLFDKNSVLYTRIMDGRMQFGSLTTIITGSITTFCVLTIVAFTIAFMVGAVCSMNYVKNCFKLSRMELETAKSRLKTVRIEGVVQIFITLLLSALAIYIRAVAGLTDSIIVLVTFLIAVGIIFLSSGILKIIAARQIKDTASSNNFPPLPPYQNTI